MNSILDVRMRLPLMVIVSAFFLFSCDGSGSPEVTTAEENTSSVSATVNVEVAEAANSPMANCVGELGESWDFFSSVRSSTQSDVNGDGRADTVELLLDHSQFNYGAGPVRVRVQFANGGVVVSKDSHVYTLPEGNPIHALDFNHEADGIEEIFFTSGLGGGTGTKQVMMAFENCELKQVGSETSSRHIYIPLTTNDYQSWGCERDQDDLLTATTLRVGSDTDWLVEQWQLIGARWKIASTETGTGSLPTIPSRCWSQ